MIGWRPSCRHFLLSARTLPEEAENNSGKIHGSDTDLSNKKENRYKHFDLSRLATKELKRRHGEHHSDCVRNIYTKTNRTCGSLASG